MSWKLLHLDSGNMDTDTVSSLNHQEDSHSFLEDIVTIDSQIELKVRGELPEIKVLNAATQFHGAKNVVLPEICV